MPKIYTHQGDQGLASILSGGKLLKSDQVFAALGDLDELAAGLGVVSAQIKQLAPIGEQTLIKQILRVETELLRAGTMLAVGNKQELAEKYNFLTAADVLRLEKEIDLWQDQLPALKNFLLPGGNSAGAQVHFIRAICRRTERSLVRVDQNHPLPKVLLAYINRLSDWLFVLGRLLNKGQELVFVKNSIEPNN